MDGEILWVFSNNCNCYKNRQKQLNKVVKDTACPAQLLTLLQTAYITVIGSFHKEIWPCSSAQEAFTSRFTDLSRSAQNKLSALRFRGASPGPGCRISTIFRTWGFLQIDSEWTSSRCAVATGNWIRGRGAASPSPILIATGLWSFTAYSFLSSWFIARFSVYFHVPGFWMLFYTGYHFTCLTWSLNAMVSRVRQQGSYFRSFITSISKVEKSVVGDCFK